MTFQRGQRLDLSQEQQVDLRLDCGPGAAPVGFGYDGALEFPLARLEGNVWHLVVKNRLLSGQVTNVYVTCVK